MNCPGVSGRNRMGQSSNNLLHCNIKDSTGADSRILGCNSQEISSTQAGGLELAAKANGNSTKETAATVSKDVSKQIPTEKQPVTTFSHSKRNSWLTNLSNLSSKLASTSIHLQPSHSSTNISLSTAGSIEPHPLLNTNFLKHAVLPHAQKPIGDEPYIPALPRTSHAGFLQIALRRLSSSNNLAYQTQDKIHQVNGICERKILNVDKNRERCKIEGLNQAKLRRVAFSVDIQVMEGLKNYEIGMQEDVIIKGKKAKEKRFVKLERNKSKHENIKKNEKSQPMNKIKLGLEPNNSYSITNRKFSRKKEKIKNEARKTKKEGVQKLAEAQGRDPLGVTVNCSVASQKNITPSLKHERSTSLDPLRIYKRCCMLREISILKRIAEQLADSENYCKATGVINRLDLTGNELELCDVITLSDFLALVPVNDLVMENCGLTDECVRIILAGLLSTKHPELLDNESIKHKSSSSLQSGFVTRVVLKNNPRIGRDGWQYICTFIALCRSLKSIDLSQIPLPQSVHDSKDLEITETQQDLKVIEVSKMLGNALSGRLGSSELKLLNMAECNLNSAQIGNLVDGIVKTGLSRLGLAGNNIRPEGMEHIVRYIRNGHCESLDLANNDLRDQLEIIAGSLGHKSSLHSLSLAKCNLSLDSLSSVFPVLANLKNLKFINLSYNPELFSSNPNAIPLFRRYLPRMRALKKINLMSVSLNPDQAIALAEILPEMPSLAHVNIMENPLQNVLKASAVEIKDREEEACALYTSLMAAVRVSKTIVCVDIEGPSQESSEVVKALAKQVVAYCFWNMEHTSVPEIKDSDGVIEEKNVIVPDILLHLVGNYEELSLKDLQIEESTVTDEDYVISGTGVVKALSICLSNLEDDSGHDFTSDPNIRNISSATRADRAKEMSKNLLSTARSIRSRLQFTVKESRVGDATSYQKLISLDQTLESLIKRFEDEFPETRPFSKRISSLSFHSNLSQVSSSSAFLHPESQNCSVHSVYSETSLSDDESAFLRPIFSRHTSDVSAASRALGEEEGRMLRLSKHFNIDSIKADIESDDSEHEELLHDWVAPLKRHIDIFEGGFGVKKDLL